MSKYSRAELDAISAAGDVGGRFTSNKELKRNRQILANTIADIYRLKGDNDRLRHTLAGAGVGALGGAAIGGLIDRRNRLRGILIGALAGGALLGVAGAFNPRSKEYLAASKDVDKIQKSLDNYYDPVNSLPVLADDPFYLD